MFYFNHENKFVVKSKINTKLISNPRVQIKINKFRKCQTKSILNDQPKKEVKHPEIESEIFNVSNQIPKLKALLLYLLILLLYKNILQEYRQLLQDSEFNRKKMTRREHRK